MAKGLFADTIERRDKVQIFADILRVSARPTKVTRILRLANVQYNTFQECIEQLCEAGLLEMAAVTQRARSSRDKRTSYTFRATDRGQRWCKMVDDIYEALQETTQ
ncbi:hypothetical protein AC482_01475 [miscellaneous Crenarchaeota group-15 archaeon DG-45]|uniref:ArnR1-like winged helix-turn-helix domain-containing protein n=1 Tax=miscellaneous Crenarchaeota group-15 archaeon DG-45 TaxID=1685127 RepID=A0A0M0BS86_9ARCH|nr:MAG: hypothetical protein AC482_01475 [miscellaneous Crenarchaeota group-15 archaeon DG-45]